METETLTKEQRELQKRTDFISGLRQLADAFESRPNMEIPEYGLLIDISSSVYTYNPEFAIDEEKSRKKLAALTRAIPGKKEKVFKDYGAFWVERKFDGLVRYRVTASRETVCKKVLTGNKIIHPGKTEYIPERIEEEFTWECDEAIIGKVK